MSNVLKARLEMDRSQFTGSRQAAQKEVEDLSKAMQNTSAVVATMQREMRAAGGGTDAQKAQVKALKEEYQQFDKQIRTTKAELKSLNEVKAADPEPDTKGGHGKANKASLAHSGRATLEMVMAGQSPLQAAQIEAPRVVQAFGGGLGAMLGVGAGFAVFNKLSETISEHIAKAKELRHSMQEALRPDPSRGEQSIEAMKKRVEELNEEAIKSKPLLGVFERLWQRVGSNVSRNMAATGQLLTGNFAKEREISTDDKYDDKTHIEQKRAETLSKRAELQEKINHKLGHENDLREKAFSKGEKAVRAAELEVQEKQELAKIEEELGIPKIQSEIQEIRDNPSITPDRQRQMIEQKERDELNPAMKAADGRSKELVRDFALRKQQAALATDDEARQFESRGKQAEIQQPDAADFGNPDAILIQETDMVSKRISAAKEEVEAAEKALAIRREMGADDRDAVATLKEKAAAWMTIVDQSRIELDTLKSTTLEMQLQQQGKSGLAKIAAVEKQYDQQIDKAKLEGRTNDIPELETQKHIAVRNAEADYEQAGPAAHNAEQLQARNRQNMADRHEQRERRHQEAQAANVHSPTFDELRGQARGRASGNAEFEPVMEPGQQPDRQVDSDSLVQPDRRPDASGSITQVSINADLKGAMSGVEGLLSTLVTNLRFSEA